MELMIEHFSDFSREIFHFAWLPVLVWTVISAMILSLLHYFNKLHAQYHYHIRLALIFGLPLGLFSSWIAEIMSAALTMMGTEAVNLKVISIIPAIEIGIKSEATSLQFSDLLFGFLMLAIISGAVIYLIARIRQWLQLRRLRRSIHLTEIDNLPGVNHENLDFASGLQYKINVAVVPKQIVPVTFGVKKPVILIPAMLLKEPGKMNLAIRHELTHVANYDFLTHIFITFIQSLFWFHPLVHSLVNQLIDYREMRCDSIIISDSSVSRKEYASLLFELLPMPNLNQEITVNMAQKSSNLKQRIERITTQGDPDLFPKRSRLTVLATLLLSLSVAMACTDFQTDAVFDEEKLDLMTDLDQTGERGYHQVLIFMGEEGQSDRHESALNQLDKLRPDYIQSINILKGERAVEKYGDRALNGVIEIQTKQDPESYNTTLKALGMNAEMPPVPPRPDTVTSGKEGYFVVVEEMPELIGGLASLTQHIQYPEEARRAGIEGRVYVQFIVNEEGNVETPKVIRGIGFGADEAALEAVKKAKFTPGLQRGQPVRVQYSLPIVFRQQDSDTTG